MYKILSFLLLSVVLNLETSGQIVFESGYFINDSSKRIDCLIRNLDWKNNPAKFEYELPQTTGVQIAFIENVKEFAVHGVNKYIRSTVNIDRSSNEISRLNTERNPVFNKEQLFLKVLIEGKASLFLYEDGNLTRYFYSLNDSEIKQLVYKRHLVDGSVSENNYFKQQLLTDLKCETVKFTDAKNLQYAKKSLEHFFIDFNDCSHSEYVNYEPKQKKDLFNLTLRPGFNYSSLAIENSALGSRNIEHEKKLGFRFGVETEFILPFNKDKWSIIIEPTYQYFKSEASTEANTISGGFLVSKVDYQSIEFPVGVRHYFFLNEASKIFADISYLYDLSMNSSALFTRNDGSILQSLEVKSRQNFCFGIGYKFKDKYSLGMRYQTSREILSDYLYWRSGYQTLSVILGYSLF